MEKIEQYYVGKFEQGELGLAQYSVLPHEERGFYRFSEDVEMPSSVEGRACYDELNNILSDSGENSDFVWAFDLDNTLGPANEPVPLSMAEKLVAAIRAGREIVIVTAKGLEGIDYQLLQQMRRCGWDETLPVTLLALQGAACYRIENGEISTLWYEPMPEDLKSALGLALKQASAEFGIECKIEDRGAQLTWTAKVENKDVFDPSGSKRNEVMRRVRELLGQKSDKFAIKIGGRTALDCTVYREDGKAYDKCTALEHLLGDTLSERKIVFFGDCLKSVPEGNDFAVVRLQGVAKMLIMFWVGSVVDTEAILQRVWREVA